MGRSIDQDVHAAFVEFRAKEDDKCLSVQCIYCQQIRAKNTSRQKQHLLECPGLQNHPSAQRPSSNNENSIASSSGYGPPPPTTLSTPSRPMSNNTNMNNSSMNNSSMNNSSMNNGPMTNGINTTPTPTFATRPSLPPPNDNPNTNTTVPNRQTPKPTPANTTTATSATTVTKPTPSRSTPGSNLPAPPLDDVHAAFVEFRAKEEDKCLSVQCIYCNQIRAKNTSRQRQHLLECPTYLNVMKDSIPANNLNHRFDENDVARSISLPTPTLELDFRMSIKLNPRVSVGPATFGQRNWLSYIGGSWAGRWGKGIVIPGGQDCQLVVKELATQINATYLIQTSDEPPAFITARTKGWWTGSKEVMERMQDAEFADTVPANQYKFRIHVELECGDERYQFLNTLMWLGTGCKRGGEIIYDAYRIG